MLELRNKFIALMYLMLMGLLITFTEVKDDELVVSEELISETEGDMFEAIVYDTPIDVNRGIPASAIATKMNVVYRGIDNPITINVPGLFPYQYTASAPGLRKVGGNKYILKPGRGNEIKVVIKGTASDCVGVNDTYVFRIKDIPKANGTVRGKSGLVQIPRSSLSKATVKANLEDFDFDVNLTVTSFRFRAPGMPSKVVKGNRLTSKDIKSLSRVRNGSSIEIFDIKVKLEGTEYIMKEPTPVTINII